MTILWVIRSNVWKCPIIIGSIFCTLWDLSSDSDKLCPYLLYFSCEFMRFCTAKKGDFPFLCTILAKLMYTFQYIQLLLIRILHLCLTQEWLLWTSHHLKELHDGWFYASCFCGSFFMLVKRILKESTAWVVNDLIGWIIWSWKKIFCQWYYWMYYGSPDSSIRSHYHP